MTRVGGKNNGKRGGYYLRCLDNDNRYRSYGSSCSCGMAFDLDTVVSIYLCRRSKKNERKK